jgi:hypothetical protein
MIENIGVTAGKVWHFLKQNGPSPLHQIQKGVGENPMATNQAIGWLAREGKLAVDHSQKNRPIYSLRE